MKRVSIILLLLVAVPAFAASAPFRGPIRSSSLDISNPNVQNRVHTEGNVWLTVTNYGYFGNEGPGQSGALEDPCTLNWSPQGEYPAGSYQQYLYRAALWVGAEIRDDTVWVPRVSVGYDGWFDVKEMFPGEGAENGIQERSNIPDHVNCFGENTYDPSAAANQEFLAVFSDTLQDWFAPHLPLSIQVTQRSMAWNSLEFDDFIIFEFTVRNIGQDSLRNAYLGLYVDGDVGLGDELEHHMDDITGFLVTDTLTGDTFNIAYIADNDGRAANQPEAPLEYPHVAGMYVLETSQPGLTWSYNWWMSNGDVEYDYGPTWEYYCLSDSFAWTWQYGTPVGDAHQYFILNNGEHDFDLIMIGRIDEVPPQHVILPDGSEVDRPWCIGNAPEDGDVIHDFANGYDVRYAISCGPLGVLDHIEPTGERIYRLNPGEEFKITLAFVFGENFHNPDHPQPDPHEIDPSLFDFTSLLQNARRARTMFESNYTYQPPVAPREFRPTGTADGAVPLSWSLPPYGTMQGANVFGVDSGGAGQQVQLNEQLITDRSFTVSGLNNGVDWLFRIQTVDDSGFHSGYADTLVRVGAPFPIRGLEARLDSSVVNLRWYASYDPLLTNYRVLRRSDHGDSTTFLSGGTRFTDQSALIGYRYTYWIVAENLRGVSSIIIDSVVVTPWDPERRILVIDETDTLVGAAEPVRGGINDDSVFAWYERLLTQTGEDFDIIEQPRQAELIYSFEMLAGYDLVIWYSEDNKPYEYVNPETVAFREEMLRAYVNAGGRLMRCGRRMLKTIIPYYGVIEYIDGYILDEWLAPMTFDSAYAWPAFSNAYNRIQFVGANADNPSFPSFMLDTAKVRIPRWGSEHLNYLPEIDILWPRGETHSIYRTVVLPTDSTGFGNQPCGVMGQGEILLTFPLYFLYEADAQALLDSCIRVLRTYTFDIPDEPEPFIPSSVALHQNYPNPFNSATTFRFDLPQNDRVQLIIYNLLGQQVRVLLDQPFTAGSHLVTWDGKGATGQPLSSGVYVARMSANAARQSVKVVMLR